MDSFARNRSKFVDNRVDPRRSPRLPFELPEGAVGTPPTQGTCPRRQRRDHPRRPRDGAAAAEMISRPAELTTRRRWPTDRSLRALPCPWSGGPPGTSAVGSVGGVRSASRCRYLLRPEKPLVRLRASPITFPADSRRMSVARGRILRAMPAAVALGDLPERLDALESAVRTRTDLVPQLGIVLGSGLGGLADARRVTGRHPLRRLPGWPAASAPGHAGRLLLGRLGGCPWSASRVDCTSTRAHPPGLVVEPVLLMGRLGAPRILITNAAGGVNAAWPPGTLMAHHRPPQPDRSQPAAWARTPDALGPRFPDLIDAWNPELRARLHAAARRRASGSRRASTPGSRAPPTRRRPRCACCGPWAPTPSACRRSWRRSPRAGPASGLAGVSLVTNPGAGVTGEPLTHEEVLAGRGRGGAALERS